MDQATSELKQQNRPEPAAIKTASVGKSRRFEFLDVLRGCAALLVFLEHMIERDLHQKAAWSEKFLNFGQLGVVTFFIVSGFIIPVSIEKYGSLGRFWTARFLRLWPVYVLSFLGVMLLDIWLPDPNVARYIQFHPVLFVAGNLTMLEEYFRIPFAIGTYWTLGVELIFYVLCSVLFVAGQLKHYWRWLWISIAVQLGLVTGTALFFHVSLPAGRIGLFVSAMFGTMLYREMNHALSWKKMACVVAAIFAVFAVTFWIHFDLYKTSSEIRLTGRCAILTWALAYGLFIIMYSVRNREFPRVLRWLGEISYPLYLFQGIVFRSFQDWLRGPLFVIASLATILTIAHLVHVLVELPVGRFQHKILGKKMAPGRAAVAV